MDQPLPEFRTLDEVLDDLDGSAAAKARLLAYVVKTAFRTCRTPFPDNPGRLSSPDTQLYQFRLLVPPANTQGVELGLDFSAPAESVGYAHIGLRMEIADPTHGKDRIRLGMARLHLHWSGLKGQWEIWWRDELSDSQRLSDKHGEHLRRTVKTLSSLFPAWIEDEDAHPSDEQVADLVTALVEFYLRL